MKDVNILIGNNLKKLREDRGFSIGALADLVQVSKSMLAQIEKGETNPSVGTIWKIANGLRVSFTELLSEPNELVKVVRKKDLKGIKQEDEKYAIYSYFPYDREKKFEIYTMALEGTSEHYSEAHVKGVEEYFIVNEGEIIVHIGNDMFHLHEGDAITFKAEEEHRYSNPLIFTAKGTIVLYYNE